MKRQILVMCIFLLILASMALAQMTVKDSDSNVLMAVQDEGAAGTIMLPQGGVPGNTTDKLYNVGGTLYWNGDQLGTTGSAGGWTDDGTVVRLSTSTDKVGIGVTTPAYPLDVDTTIGINNTQVLYLPNQTDFEGTLYLGDGGGSLSHGSISEGQFNTAVGIGALNDNTTADGNTAIGYQALMNNTGGRSNTAIGAYALEGNAGGEDNVACGWGALYMNATGDANVGIGRDANFWNQGGSSNVIIGKYAGFGMSLLHSKEGNVFIGHEAGYSAWEGYNYNVCIGYQAGYGVTGSNKLYIENSNSSSPLIGGDFSEDELYFNGDVGIGTTSPGSRLHVEGPITHATASYSSNYTLTDSDCVLFVDTGGGDVTITMPAASSSTVGRKYYIYKVSGAYTVYVEGNGSETIVGTSSTTAQWSLLTIIGYSSSSWISTP